MSKSYVVTEAELHSLAARVAGSMAACLQEGVTFVSGDEVDAWLKGRPERGEVVTSCPDDLCEAVNNSDEFQWIVYDMGLMPEQIKTKEQVCALRAAWMMYQALSDVRQLPAPVVAVPSVETSLDETTSRALANAPAWASRVGLIWLNDAEVQSRHPFRDFSIQDFAHLLATTKQAPDVGAVPTYVGGVNQAGTGGGAVMIDSIGPDKKAPGMRALAALESTPTANPQQNDAQTGMEER